VPDIVTVQWPDVLPEDEAVTTGALMQELEMGIISKETYRSIRGYDHDLEEDRIGGETETGDVGTNILNLMAANRPFNRGV